MGDYQYKLFDDYVPGNEADIVYTPKHIAKDIVNHFKPQGKCLDPCKGGGVFYELLPPDADWCEIGEGIDFFAYNKHVDWVIGNPPYSIFTEWLRHSFKIADNIAYLIPIAKVYAVDNRMKEIYSFGGIVETRYYGKGTETGFPFGFPCGVVYLKRGYTGDIKVSFYSP